MRHLQTTKMIVVIACALALTACGRGEVKTGSLTQRFTLIDAEGRHFGVVEMDPVGGGRITDVQGRVVGQIIAPSSTSTIAVAPLPAVGAIQ